MKLPDTLLQTLALSAASLLLPSSPAGTTVVSIVNSERDNAVFAANIKATPDTIATPEPPGVCTACGRG